jgi:hypothetical protein
MIYRFGTFVYDSDERLLVGEHVHLRLAEVPHRLLTTLLVNRTGLVGGQIP